MLMTKQEEVSYRKMTAAIHYPVINVDFPNAFQYIGKYLRCIQPESAPPEERRVGQISGIADDENVGLGFRCIDISDNSEWYVWGGVILPNPQCILQTANISDKKDS